MTLDKHHILCFVKSTTFVFCLCGLRPVLFMREFAFSSAPISPKLFISLLVFVLSGWYILSCFLGTSVLC